MAKANIGLIQALRQAARKLKNGARYQWGHMGSCNCGHLAQELTRMSPADIHAYALRTRTGDWADQTSEFCATSNLPMDLVISDMLAAGLTRKDLQNLERLSDTTIISEISEEKKPLRHNFRDDVVIYLNTWANILERDLNLDEEEVQEHLETEVATTELVFA